MFVSTCILLAGCNPQTNESNSEEEKDRQKVSSEDHDHDESIATVTAEQMKSVDIELGTLEMKELTATVKANGMLRVPNNNKGNATALFGGVIKTLNVQIGSFVKKGQVIATIANPQFIQIQEEYLSVESRIVLAELELKRQRDLVDGKAGAAKNLQNAMAEMNGLQTRRASLRQQIQLMGINPVSVSNENMKASLSILSPLSGTVSDVFAKIGSYVDVSTPVAEIVDNSSLHLDLQVFEKDLPKMKVGQIIHFTLTNNPETEYDARIFSIGSTFENESKTIAVHCDVTGKKDGLIDGMNITAVVSLNNQTTPAVPNTAIVEADGKYYIFVATAQESVVHQHEESEDHQHDTPKSKVNEKGDRSFRKMEVVKGVSEMGFTAITPVQDIAPGTSIVIKGAFFVNATLTNQGEHEH